MVTTWGGPDAIATAPQPTLPGFDRFMIERFSPLCWELPSSRNFDLKDAQAKYALGEAALMKKAIYTKTGQQYLDFLRDVELRGTGMGDAAIVEFLKALAEFDSKQFRTYFQVCLIASLCGRTF